MNLTEQQALLIIARHEGYEDARLLDYNFIEPIWNEWLDRVVEMKCNLFCTDYFGSTYGNLGEDAIEVTKADVFDWHLSLRTPLQKANAIIEYWLAVGEITEEDLK